MIGINRFLEADKYINPIGGLKLYDKSSFRQHGLELVFLKSRPVTYPQQCDTFIPFLSIIDVMMSNSPIEIKHLLMEFDLI